MVKQVKSLNKNVKRKLSRGIVHILCLKFL